MSGTGVALRLRGLRGTSIMGGIGAADFTGGMLAVEAGAAESTGGIWVEEGVGTAEPTGGMLVEEVAVAGTTGGMSV